MKKYLSACFFALALALVLSGCAGACELVSLSPEEVGRLYIESPKEACIAVLNRFDDAVVEQMDALIRQLKTKYRSQGACDHTEHQYQITLCQADGMPLFEAYLNDDGTICANDKRYLQQETDADAYDLEAWESVYMDYRREITYAVQAEPGIGAYSQGVRTNIAGAFYQSVLADGSRTLIYGEFERGARPLLELEGEWQLSLAEGTQDAPYTLFYGMRNDGTGWDKYANAIYVYSNDTGDLYQYLDKPCSNPILMPGSRVAWTLCLNENYGNVLLPIDCDTGSSYIGNMKSLKKLKLFQNPGRWGTHVTSRLELSSEDPNALVIVREIINENAHKKREMIYSYSLETDKLKFVNKVGF